MPRIQDPRDLRKEVLNELKRSPAPLQLLDLSKRLRIKSDSDDYEYLRQTLTKLCEDGSVRRLSRRRFSMAKRDTSGFTGTLSLYHGSGSVETGDPDMPKIQVRLQNLNTALDGDVVVVKPHAIRDGKKVRGEVTAVIERSPHPVGGTIEFDGSFYYLIPDDEKYYVDFLVAEKNLNGAKPGDKVAGVFMRWEHANSSPEAKVSEVLGESGRAVVEFTAIYKEFNLPAGFPKVVEAEAALAKPPTGKVPKGRTDLRKEDIITIDPDDAKDFDDALSLRKLKNGNVELGVHIADVSHYVQPGTELDREALNRGNSTYLVDGVVPMLPEHLSTDVCSLVPNKPRFAFSIFMEFDNKGNRKRHRIEETVIKSKRRFTYDEAQQILDGNNGDYEELVRDLRLLADSLYSMRMKSGGVDFETQELKFILDENKMPVEAVLKSRTDATSLVEECMLAANQAVAEHVQALKKEWRTNEPPALIYRIHEEPDPEKIKEAVDVVRALGLDVPNGKLTPMQINKVLHAARERPDKAVVNTLFLRSMSKAVYAEQNVGHYGLGFKAYAHFTSPIRRYPDLYVHRALKEYAQGQPTERRLRWLNNKASDVSDHTSLTEREAVKAERASTKLAQVILAREHVGETYPGVVTGVTSFGVFITLQGLPVEGLLHIKDLNDDYYFFDEQRYRLLGRRSRRVLQFGSELMVTITRADIEKRNIDLAEKRTEEQEKKAASKPPRKDPSKSSNKPARKTSSKTTKKTPKKSVKKAAKKNAKKSTGKKVAKKVSKKPTSKSRSKRRSRES